MRMQVLLRRAEGSFEVQRPQGGRLGLCRRQHGGQNRQDVGREWDVCMRVPCQLNQ